MDWFPLLFWSGPIGLGVFLAGLGVLFWGIGRAREADKKVKEGERSDAAVKNE